MRIVTVLTKRTLYGGLQEFSPKHVQALHEQIQEHAPGAQFECMTDMRIDGVQCRPLRHDWPGWWAKMELLDPEVPGDFLFMDIDTVVRGPLTDILAVRKLTMLRDFYRDGKKLKEGLGSGLMYVPADARSGVWGMWRQQPQLCMRMYPGGDQRLLEKFWLNKADRFQDVVPGQIVSWKVNCQNGIAPDARVIAFHGKPRPWEVGQFHHLYR
jgi:hypothetical protein